MNGVIVRLGFRWTFLERMSHLGHAPEHAKMDGVSKMLRCLLCWSGAGSGRKALPV